MHIVIRHASPILDTLQRAGQLLAQDAQQAAGYRLVHTKSETHGSAAIGIRLQRLALGGCSWRRRKPERTACHCYIVRAARYLSLYLSLAMRDRASVGQIQLNRIATELMETALRAVMFHYALELHRSRVASS
jgi:hypothetical protein